MTFDALAAVLKAYRPMCAPTSTTTSPAATWNERVTKGSCLEEIKSKSFVRGRTSNRTPSTDTPKFVLPRTQKPTDPERERVRIRSRMETPCAPYRETSTSNCGSPTGPERKRAKARLGLKLAVKSNISARLVRFRIPSEILP